MTGTRSYHHGNLYSATLDLARATVVERGHGALAMRDLANQLEVSVGALYRHFADRDALLLSLANAGHEELLASLQTAVERHSEPRQAVRAAAEEFLVFCTRHKRLFLLMYDGEVINLPDADEHLPALQQLYAVLGALFARALPNASAVELRLRMLRMWSTLYGFASIVTNGLLKPYMRAQVTNKDMTEVIVRAALESLDAADAALSGRRTSRDRV